MPVSLHISPGGVWGTSSARERCTVIYPTITGEAGKQERQYQILKILYFRNGSG
jgi:hypothetical protein